MFILYDVFMNYSYRKIKELLKNAKTKDKNYFYMSLANRML